MVCTFDFRASNNSIETCITYVPNHCISSFLLLSWPLTARILCKEKLDSLLKCKQPPYCIFFAVFTLCTRRRMPFVVAMGTKDWAQTLWVRFIRERLRVWNVVLRQLTDFKMSTDNLSLMRHNNSGGKTLLDNWVEEVCDLTITPFAHRAIFSMEFSHTNDCCITNLSLSLPPSLSLSLLSLSALSLSALSLSSLSLSCVFNHVSFSEFLNIFFFLWIFNIKLGTNRLVVVVVVVVVYSKLSLKLVWSRTIHSIDLSFFLLYL